MLPTPELRIARHLPPAGCAPGVAQRYTRWLATHHYENFKVVSWLLPPRLRQHFYNLYAYCRWSDDLGDEVNNARRALELLDAWEDELRLCYGVVPGPSHPVLIALRETIRAKELPIRPLVDLLRAFRQDQRVHRYATWEDMIGYCVYSANPVGHLVLYLCGYGDEERQRLSDCTCTALQLANFWQDVSRDLDKGRIYIPLDLLAEHGVAESEIVERRFSSRYAELMKELIARTRLLFAAGLPLVERVEPFLRVDIELFTRGGLAVLDAIEAMGYNTLEHRPTLTRWTQARLFGGALFTRVAGARSPFAPALSKGRAPVAGLDARGGRVERSEREIDESYSECVHIARAARSNFYISFHALPKQKRRALCALYAFMRLVDDASDKPGDLASKQRELAAWRKRLEATVAGDTRGHRILPAFADAIARYQIPTRYFHDLISGAEMDLTVASYATFDRLSEYCYRVAGTVGLTCLHVFGFRDPHAPDLAERLGLAFQLTNILRDIPKDYEMGRIYIPEEDCRRFSVLPEALRGPVSENLAALLEFQAERAWRFYKEGAPLVSMVEADSQSPLWALIRTYSSLLARIEQRGYDVFSSRVALTRAGKAQVIAAAGMRHWWKRDALAKRSGDRRRPRGSLLRHRTG